MSQSTTVVKTVGGVTTRTTTTSRTISSKSSTQQQSQQQSVVAKPVETKAIEDVKSSVTITEDSSAKQQQKRGKENSISVKKSFTKFDALQKKQQQQKQELPPPKLKPQTSENEGLCVRCNKTVYKMEEIKAEHQIWHKNCFRCKECDKPLKVDNFQSHEGVVYCKPHFKQLLGPKAVDDANDAPKRKPELIIRENQPAELPEGVVRSSDKQDLGLEEIQTSDVKKRFQLFEKISTTKDEPEELQHQRGVKRSATILSKLKKFHAKGMDVGVSEEELKKLKNGDAEEPSEEDDDDNESIDSADYDDDVDVDLIRAKRAQRERPLSFANMSDIKSKFENGVDQGKEERHKERKQEIQNIRSRLFMGKQARIKEMYQNAVAETEVNPKLKNKSFATAFELDNVKASAEKARNIKERFETGDVYRKPSPVDPSIEPPANSVLNEDKEMFEVGLGKNSRNMFQQMDAQAKQQESTSKTTVTRHISNKVSERMQKLATQQANDEVIKSDAKVNDVEIKTADISNKFRFFENYNPEENKRKEFRITPPREGVVKIPKDSDDESEEEDEDEDEHQTDRNNNNLVKKAKSTYIERVMKSESRIKNQGIDKVLDMGLAKERQTASQMLNVFKKMEERQKQPSPNELKPLKSFTPPPEEDRRYHDISDSDEDGDDRKGQFYDPDLEHARQAARARDLKERFEKWDVENNVDDEAVYNDSIPQYDDDYGDSQTESTKTIRAKFEEMRNTSKSQRSERPQVHRFV